MAERLRILAGMAFFLLSICAASPYNACAASPDTEEDKILEEVIVTGTRIPRRDFDTPSPLTTIGSADIEFTPLPTLEETLNRMPQVAPGYGRASNNPGNGTATVDLRHMGAERSLVLLNGRRMQASGIGSEVDLTNIPRFLVERIEIITGGASAVYGSDAIAGAVNFITRKDYTGLELEAGYAMTEQCDANAWDFNLAWGHDFADGRGNIALYAALLERDPLLAGEREFTSVAYFDDWDGNLVPTGSTRTPDGVVFWPLADIGDGPVQVTFHPDGTPRAFVPPDDYYNYQPVNYLQIPLERRTVGGMGHYEFFDGFEGYFEASHTRSEPTRNLAPVPADLFLTVNLDNPVLTPEAQQLFRDNFGCDENLACILYGKRLVELGPRLIDFERDYTRMVTGVAGELGAGWRFDASFTYAKVSDLEFYRNDASRSRFQQGMLIDPLTSECYDTSRGCVPLNVFGANNLTAEAAEFIRLPDYADVLEREHQLASFTLTGSPFTWRQGPVSLVLGAEWRSDNTFRKANEILFTGDTLGFNPRATVNGAEQILETYAEALVPLAVDTGWADRLDLELGARHSMYERADNAWTWKFGFSWTISDSLRMRAMRQRSVRAPNSNELFEEQYRTEWTWVRADPAMDPCSASADPVGRGNADKCVLQGLPADQVGIFEATPYYPVALIRGGNPVLSPEDGQTWTVGSVISPQKWPGLTISVDYYLLEVTDTIGAIDSGNICFDPLNASHLFCENLRRDASGNVAEIYNLTSNRGILETSGVDTQFHYRADLAETLSLPGQAATLDISLYWTHVLTAKEQENPATEVLSCSGYYGWPCAFSSYPENRVTTNLLYASGPLEAHLSWRWIDAMKNAAPMRSAIFGSPDPDLAVPAVGDRHYFDLGVSYAFGDHYRVQLSIANLLDTGPPQMADAVLDNNTDQGLYDVFGRSYRLALYARF
jgi:iron complex outermembrane receptor protein